MIFTLEKTPTNEPIIKPSWASSIDANDLFDLLVSTYPKQSIYLVNFNGYENAVMLTRKLASIDNYSKWERAIKRNFPHNAIIFHRGHNYVYARIDSSEVGRYSIR